MSKRTQPREDFFAVSKARTLLSMVSKDQKLLVRLQNFIRSPDERTRQQAQSLVLWYLRHQDWTGPQRRLVKTICRLKVK